MTWRYRHNTFFWEWTIHSLQKPKMKGPEIYERLFYAKNLPGLSRRFKALEPLTGSAKGVFIYLQVKAPESVCTHSCEWIGKVYTRLGCGAVVCGSSRTRTPGDCNPRRVQDDYLGGESFWNLWGTYFAGLKRNYLSSSNRCISDTTAYFFVVRSSRTVDFLESILARERLFHQWVWGLVTGWNLRRNCIWWEIPI